MIVMALQKTLQSVAVCVELHALSVDLELPVDSELWDGEVLDCGESLLGCDEPSPELLPESSTGGSQLPDT